MQHRTIDQPDIDKEEYRNKVRGETGYPGYNFTYHA
jgi:hypothetical protein